MSIQKDDEQFEKGTLPLLLDASADIVLFFKTAGVGNLIKGLFDRYQTYIEIKRIKEQLKLIVDELSQYDLGKYKVDRENEDFHDFATTIFETTVKVRTHQRRNALAKIFTKAVTNSFEYNSSVEVFFIKHVGELSDLQVQILEVIANNASSFRRIASFDNARIKLWGFGVLPEYPEMIKSALSGLENLGLVDTQGIVASAEFRGFNVTSDEEGNNASLVITDYGLEFLSYLISSN